MAAGYLLREGTGGKNLGCERSSCPQKCEMLARSEQHLRAAALHLGTSCFLGDRGGPTRGKCIKYPPGPQRPIQSYAHIFIADEYSTLLPNITSTIISEKFGFLFWLTHIERYHHTLTQLQHSYIVSSFPCLFFSSLCLLLDDTPDKL